MRASWNLLGGKPLLVFSATENETFSDMMEPWLEMQADLASLSSESRHRPVEGASHIALVTDPHHLREATDNLREFSGEILSR